MDAGRLTHSGFLCILLMSMLMLVVCDDTDNTSCISTLSSCAPYLNATKKPDPSCCSALISVIDKDSQCLCNLLHSDAVKQLGVNVTKAMALPAECGKNVTANQCPKTAAAGSSSVGKTPTVTPTSPSASSSTTTKTNSNVAASVAAKMLPVAALVFVAVGACLPVGL